jgi:hypothetical protein
MCVIIEQALIVAKGVHPQSFKAWFAGFIANIVAQLPDDYWAEFIKVKPCGRVGCTCHLDVAFHGAQLFKLLREDYKQFGPSTGSGSE